MALDKFEIDRTLVRALTMRLLELEIEVRRVTQVACGSFTLSDLLGTVWGPAYVPFYRAYGENRVVAGQEMGKLLGVVAKRMGLRSMKENRFGKKDAITRYFFN